MDAENEGAGVFEARVWGDALGWAAEGSDWIFSGLGNARPAAPFSGG